MAAKDKTPSNFTQISARKSLGTMLLLDEIRVMLGVDEYGRDIPRYVVVHQALLAYRDQIKGGQAQTPPDAPTTTP